MRDFETKGEGHRGEPERSEAVTSIVIRQEEGPLTIVFGDRKVDPASREWQYP